MKMSEMLDIIIKKRVNISEFMLVQTYKDWMLTFGKHKEERFRLTKDEFAAILARVKGK